ncbi:MAG: DNA double-strand break repair nuclease NurA [Syntrophothermus sp.]|uniref:DNA double-strand break repair nuclease NurA n=1 Tax=Syntrophothermus sp. TaxID=2736299 RepID=UPI00257C4EFA|nr:DNA double-strand break repair nuclease NurA [Syntrophothermus sp.]NSW84249.1 DNA double-strand break repair nuclease NurA [Syntrophothermus sp.]
MPNTGERSGYIALSRIAGSEKVRGFLASCVVRSPAERGGASKAEELLRIDQTGCDSLPRFVIAIDGSWTQVPVENGFPGAEVGFVSVALVLLDLERIRHLSAEQFPAPPEVNRTVRTGAGELVLPGCNVQRSDARDPKHSFRHQLFEELASIRSADDGESLLDTYHALLSYKSSARDERCPYDDCPKDTQSFDRGLGAYTCSCSLQRPLYSTDALRIHESFNLTGPSGQAYGEAMQVIERLLLINFLRTLEQKGWLDSLAQIALVVDGPLAVFGHPAWLKDAISKELQRLNQAAKRITGRDILLLGIEKSGAFLEHFIRLDTSTTGSPGTFPPGTVLLLTDAYIKDHIVLTKSERPYGYQTYFGRKFFYKTRSGARIVGMTPYLEEGDSDLSVAFPDQFPRLPEAVALLDALVSSRHPDLVVPLVEAHAQATIARGLGTRVLEQLVKELVRRGPR